MVSKYGSADITDSASRSKRARLCTSAALSASLSLIAFIILRGNDRALGFIPLLIVLPMLVHLALSRKKSVDPNIILNESPTVIGMMSTAIMSGSSLDTAVREISVNGPKETSSIFKGVVRKTDLRIGGDIKDNLIRVSNELPEGASPFKRGLHMIVSASETSERNERYRMLKDSEQIALNGLKDMGNRYGSSVNNPCMLIFGLGIMVPMVLVSILPMLTVGGSFSISFLSMNMIAFITLILVPAVMGVIIYSISSGSPFKTTLPRTDLIPILPILSAIPMFAFLNWTGYQMVVSLAASVAFAGSFTALCLYPGHIGERKRKRISHSLEDMLFDLGNKLTAGDPFERSLIEIMNERKECTDLGRSMERSFRLCRGDIHAVLGSVLSEFSTSMADSYLKIYESSLKDVRKAGELAISLGHQIQNVRSVNSEMENRLKSMKDMMTWTAAAFAPIIMGLSLVLLKPLSSISDSLESGMVSLILCIYLIELAFMISILNSSLGVRNSVSSIFFRFGLMVPISMIIFLAVSGISI